MQSQHEHWRVKKPKFFVFQFVFPAPVMHVPFGVGVSVFLPQSNKAHCKTKRETAENKNSYQALRASLKTKFFCCESAKIKTELVRSRPYKWVCCVSFYWFVQWTWGACLVCLLYSCFSLSIFNVFILANLPLLWIQTSCFVAIHSFASLKLIGHFFNAAEVCFCFVWLHFALWISLSFFACSLFKLQFLFVCSLMLFAAVAVLPNSFI